MSDCVTRCLVLEREPILDWADSKLGEGAAPTTILFIGTVNRYWITINWDCPRNYQTFFDGFYRGRCWKCKWNFGNRFAPGNSSLLGGSCGSSSAGLLQRRVWRSFSMGEYFYIFVELKRISSLYLGILEVVGRLLGSVVSAACSTAWVDSSTPLSASPSAMIVTRLISWKTRQNTY